jgi:NAD(P)-dependent dehydrogenase (short-subunit alcohol dehydrogenase family)
MATDFEGKKIVVIGGTSGIGLKTAENVIAEGGSAVIVGRPGRKLDDAVTSLSRSGTASSIAADLTDWEQVVEAQKQLAENHADATLLVNAAGLVRLKPFLDYEVADYDSYHDLNRATFFLTQTIVRGMIAGGQGGAIVNVGAMWAHQALAATPSSAFSMAKAGLHALTHNLAIELAGEGIRVNAVAPAVTNTPHFDWIPASPTCTASAPPSGSSPGSPRPPACWPPSACTRRIGGPRECRPTRTRRVAGRPTNAAEPVAAPRPLSSPGLGNAAIADPLQSRPASAGDEPTSRRRFRDRASRRRL